VNLENTLLGEERVRTIKSITRGLNYD